MGRLPLFFSCSIFYPAISFGEDLLKIINMPGENKRYLENGRNAQKRSLEKQFGRYGFCGGQG